MLPFPVTHHLSSMNWYVIFLNAYHRQSAGWVEHGTNLFQQSWSILTSWQVWQFRGLRPVWVRWTGGGIQWVAQSRGWVVGEIGGLHAIWQGWGSYWWNGAAIIAQTPDWKWLKRYREIKTAVRPVWIHQAETFLCPCCYKDFNWHKVILHVIYCCYLLPGVCTGINMF